MNMLFLPTHQLHSFPVAAIFAEETFDQRACSRSGVVRGGTIPLSEISIGETRYRLREPLCGKFLPGESVPCEFWVDRFSPTFVGKGIHAQDAYRDWRDQVHEAFQDLYRRRPFELTSEDRARWNVLESLIDVVSYRNETPMVVRQIGKVSQARPLPRKVTWIDGRSDYVSLELMPPEFASYRPGQPFEADVERDPRTGRLLRVRYVRRIKAIPPMSDSELQTFWDSLPGTTGLRVSERNWAGT
jgi:hypothetical protein